MQSNLGTLGYSDWLSLLRTDLNGVARGELKFQVKL